MDRLCREERLERYRQGVQWLGWCWWKAEWERMVPEREGRKLMGWLGCSKKSAHSVGSRDCVLGAQSGDYLTLMPGMGLDV